MPWVDFKTMSSSSTQLIRSQSSSHNGFPPEILAGMNSAEGASRAALEDLDTFIFSLFTNGLPKNFFVQMAVAGTLIAILLVVGLIVIYQRFRKQAFWVFKATRRSEGIYIVPNALNTFLLFEGVFACVWLTFIIVQYFAYWKHQEAMLHNIGTLNLIVWWPLWIGAFMAGWGSFYTAPGALDKGPLSSNLIGKVVPRPIIVNIFCIGTPIALIVSLLPPIILTQTHLNSALAVYQSFSSDISSAIAKSGANEASVVTKDTAAEFLDRANTIWDMELDTAYYMAIGYAIWPIWAGLFLLFYIPAGGTLVYLVWGQMQKQKNALKDLQQRYVEEEAIRIKHVKEARHTEAGNGPKDQQRTDIKEYGALLPPDQSAPLLFEPLTSSKGISSTAVPEDAANLRTTFSETQVESEGSDGSEQIETFYPPLRPDIQKRAARVTKEMRDLAGTPSFRYNYLKRCFINLTLLYVGIILGAALYLGVSASLARYLYESYKKGPTHIAHIVYISCVVAAWGAVVFGTLCVAAIIARLIDPANAPSPIKRGEHTAKERHEKSHLKLRSSKSSNFLSAICGHGKSEQVARLEQDEVKSRTIPAVPESVGVTVDELMTGVSATSSWRPDRSILSNDNTRAIIPIDKRKKLSLKFNLDSKPGVGFIIKPTDTNNLSQSQFSTDGAGSMLSREENQNYPTPERTLYLAQHGTLQRRQHSELQPTNTKQQKKVIDPTFAPFSPSKPLPPARYFPASHTQDDSNISMELGESENPLRANDASVSSIEEAGWVIESFDDEPYTNVPQTVKSLRERRAHNALLSGLPEPLSTQSEMQGQTFAPLTINTKNSKCEAEIYSPSVDVALLKDKDIDLSKRNTSPTQVYHPNAGIPPTPSTASTFTSAVNSSPSTIRQPLTIHTDRQIVPSPNSKWKALEPYGWYQLPEEDSNKVIHTYRDDFPPSFAESPRSGIPSYIESKEHRTNIPRTESVDFSRLNGRIKRPSAEFTLSQRGVIGLSSTASTGDLNRLLSSSDKQKRSPGTFF